MDSSTTTALSMSIPTPSINPIMERTLRLRWVTKRKQAVPMTEMGMASETMRVVPMRSRKKNRTATASTPPMAPEERSPFRLFVIWSPWSKKSRTSIPLSAGSWLMRASSVLIDLTTSTVLAPLAFCTQNATAGSRFKSRP